MNSAHQIINEFAQQHRIDWDEFNEWFRDAGFSECEANPHDSRYLDHLETYLEEREG